jgi:predicted enzyme related to lactoylglutathione lyase
MLQKLRTVIYHVSDLQAAKEWYIKCTGLQPYFDEPFYVGFDIHGCELGLDPDMTGVSSGNQAVAYWQVEDIHTAVEKFVDAGAAVIQDINEVGGGISVATLADPFGNHIGFIQGA